MTEFSKFLEQAVLTCESCDFTAEGTGAAMMHAMTIGHTVSGQTPEGDTVTISTEPIDD
jgi:hypothetical protein